MDKSKLITLILLIATLTVVAVFIVYVMTPGENHILKQEKIRKAKIKNDYIRQRELQNKIAQAKEVSDPVLVPKFQEPVSPIEQIHENQHYNIPLPKGFKIVGIEQIQGTVDNVPLNSPPVLDSNNMLDELGKLPGKTQSSIQYTANKILNSMGYPDNLVTVYITDIDQSNAKFRGSYQVGKFDFITGSLEVSKQALYSTNQKVMVAIIAHELDHFDKLNKLSKSIGIDNYAKILGGNSNFAYSFWQNANKYADTSNFDTNLYSQALNRMVSQNQMDLVSSYADFYRLSENVRNPFEISAYNVSDSISNYYGLSSSDDPMKIIADKFNTLDWAVYNMTQKDNDLKNSRIAIFDYLYIKAINSLYPAFISDFDRYRSSGNLTRYWLDIENYLGNFYAKGKMDIQTTSKIINLLDRMIADSSLILSSQQISDAMWYKTKTLAANMVYPNAINDVRTIGYDFLHYNRMKHISRPADDLSVIIILICLDNNITSENCHVFNNNVTAININSELRNMLDNNTEYLRLVGYGYTGQELQSQKHRVLLDLIHNVEIYK